MNKKGKITLETFYNDFVEFRKEARNTFVTKDEFNKLIIRVINIESDFKDYKNQTSTKEDIRTLTNAIDAFMHRDETYRIWN